MQLREKFTKKMSGEDIIAAVTEGKPGALAAIQEIRKVAPDQTGIAVLAQLADMNIRGSQLAYAFQEFCNSNAIVLIGHVDSRNPKMVNAVNAFFESAPSEMPYKAVIRGAMDAPEIPVW